jgi:TolB protein
MNNLIRVFKKISLIFNISIISLLILILTILNISCGKIFKAEITVIEDTAETTFEETEQQITEDPTITQLTVEPTEEPTTPAQKPVEYKEKWIVFASDMDGDLDLYRIKLDGTGLDLLMSNKQDDFYPAPSPDGKLIAYASVIKGNYDIFIMNPDGTNRRNLTNHPAQDAYPCWSPDGKYIFFQSNRDGNLEIYRMNSDGKKLKRLTFNAAVNDWHVTCHPFFDEIIFESGSPGREDIYKMDYEGENIKKVSQDNRRKRMPVISPNADIIAFVSYKGGSGDKHREIFTMTYYGEDIKDITQNPNREDSHPSFSPDGEFIVYHTEDGRGNYSIMIMKPDGSGKKEIFTSHDKNWDPDFLYIIKED